MRIAVTAMGIGLDSEIDPRFARACYILIFDSEGRLAETVDNRRNVSSVLSPTAQVCKLLADKGVDVVVTGSCGSAALRILRAAGIKVGLEEWGTTVRVGLERHFDIGTFQHGSHGPPVAHP